jgi:rubredoxin
MDHVEWLEVGMVEHECPVCGYCHEKKRQKEVFDDLPDAWRCPLCYTPKKDFVSQDPADTTKVSSK